MKHPDLDLFEVRKEIIHAVKEANLDEATYSLNYERNEFNFNFKMDDYDDSTMVDVLAIAKKNIENWRIHTFERGFLSIQALNNNIFHTEDILKNIKIRASGMYGEKSIEITKKSGIDPSELSLVLSLIKHFTRKKAPADPLSMLESAGCSVYHPDKNQSAFDQIAGYHNVINEVKESIILPLRHHDIYQKITESTRKHADSARPKAVLFTGPPGVGKTTMARIIARESGVPLVYIPLENIMSAYYGESTKRLALIFDLAAQYAPDDPSKGLILFLDEIDSLAPSRNEKLFEATRRMLSVLLRKIDGLESRAGYLTIGATNRRDDLDAALISRFDTIIEFPWPTREDIREILALLASHLTPADVESLSERMMGFSPREIKDAMKKAERIRAHELIRRLEKGEIAKENLTETDYLPSRENYANAVEHRKSSTGDSH